MKMFQLEIPSNLPNKCLILKKSLNVVTPLNISLDKTLTDSGKLENKKVFSQSNDGSESESSYYASSSFSSLSSSWKQFSISHYISNFFPKVFSSDYQRKKRKYFLKKISKNSILFLIITINYVLNIKFKLNLITSNNYKIVCI